MNATNTYAFFLLLFIISSCSRVDLTDVKKIEINAVNLSQDEILTNPDAMDSLNLDIAYTDPTVKASYFVISDTRYGFVGPRYYEIPDPPQDVDLSLGMQGILHLGIPLNEIMVEDTFPSERFNYRIKIFSEDSLLDSDDFYTDSLTVYR